MTFVEGKRNNINGMLILCPSWMLHFLVTVVVLLLEVALANYDTGVQDYPKTNDA